MTEAFGKKVSKIKGKSAKKVLGQNVLKTHFQNIKIPPENQKTKTIKNQ